MREVWTDLAMEEIVPTQVGVTAGTRGMVSKRVAEETQEDEEEAGEEGQGARRRKRRRAIDDDEVFARRMGTVESDPLDRLGHVAREIRGQAVRPWGTSTRPIPSSSSLRNHQRDIDVETRLDPIYASSDRTRYTFSLPAPSVSGVTLRHFGQPLSRPEEEEEEEGGGERDRIGYRTAQRIWVAEERDRILPFVAVRTGSAGTVGEGYRVKGLRGVRGMVSREGWRWDRPSEVYDGEDEEEGEEEERVQRRVGERRGDVEEEGQSWDGQVEGNWSRVDVSAAGEGQGHGEEEEEEEVYQDYSVSDRDGSEGVEYDED